MTVITNQSEEVGFVNNMVIFSILRKPLACITSQLSEDIETDTTLEILHSSEKLVSL